MTSVWLVSHFLSIVGFVLAFALMARILSERRAPASTLGWLVTIALVPYLGVPLYLIFGGRKVRRRAARKERLRFSRAESFAADQLGSVEATLRSVGVPGATFGNRLDVLATGEDAYAALIAMIDGAQHSIHLATFILGGDAVGDAVLERLTKRAAEGVEVRLLLDALFSFRATRSALSSLQKAGGKVAYFMPVLHVPFRGQANLRNHRKIVVIDGARGIVGGMNIALEYMGPSAEPGRFRDLSVFVEGPAAEQIDAIFRADWAFAAGETDVLLAPSGNQSATANATIQVVASGPDMREDTFYDAVLTGLFAAKRRAWIATPYFVPDEALARALVLAARRGVDVRVVVPARSNHFMADIAGGSYLRQVQDAGGRVCPYRAGMIHAKVTVIDEDVATIGSANMDIRSLFLDYEIALFIYSKPEIERLAAWYEDVLGSCGERLPDAGRVRAFAESVGRLVAPLV